MIDDQNREIEAADGSTPASPLEYREIFPDAHAVFSFQRRSLSEVKSQCNCVLDTTILSVPYTFSSGKFAEISKIYRTLAGEGRLWIPAHAAREFAVNRATKLTDLFKAISEKKNKASDVMLETIPLLTSMTEYTQAVEKVNGINKELDQYRKLLASLVDRLREWNWDDPVSELYRELFTDSIVLEAALSEEELSQDLERRNRLRIPPGYHDRKKKVNAAGDLIIWHTILDLGRTQKKDLILVSNDGKGDWWNRSDNQALYPRFELVDEYRRASEGSSFHMVTFSAFLKLFGATAEAVEEARREELTVAMPATTGANRWYGQMLPVVDRWLQSEFPFSYIRVAERNESCDLVLYTRHDHKWAIRIKPAADTQTLLNEISLMDSSIPSFDSGMLVVVAPSESAAVISAQGLVSFNDQTPPLIRVSVGFVNSNGEYEERGGLPLPS